MTNAFDARISEQLIRYFVCPATEVFALNSLELLNRDQYLYRLLRSEGYERIVFFRTQATGIPVYSYDKLSLCSFFFPEQFRNVDPRDRSAVRAFYDKCGEMKGTGLSGLRSTAARKPVKEYISRPEEYGYVSDRFQPDQISSDFAVHIKEAVRAGNIRTVLVFPVETFRNAATDTVVANTLTELQNESRNPDSIILFTFDTEAELKECLHYPGIHKWTNEDVIRRDSAKSITDYLKSRNRIILAERAREDEIMNLILRKKILEKVPALQELTAAEIWQIARDLSRGGDRREFLVGSAQRFVFQRADLLNALNTRVFSDPQVCEELVRRARANGPAAGVRFKAVEAGACEVARITGAHPNLVEDKDEREILAELDTYVGMDYLKREVLDLIDQFQRRKEEFDRARREGRKVRDSDIPYMTMQFVGPPGTGKTTIANLIARLFCARGILRNPEPVIYRAGELSGNGVVNSCRIQVNNAVREAIGGVLVLDEFYNFNSAYSGGNLADEAIAAIMSATDEHKDDLCVILLGYEKEMGEMFREFNPGAARRFSNILHFHSYSADDLMQIFRGRLAERGLEADEAACEAVRRVIQAEASRLDDRFGNAGFLNDLLIPALERKLQGGRITEETVLQAFPQYSAILTDNTENEEAILAELDGMVGMQYLREQVLGIVNMLQDKLQKYERRCEAASEAGRRKPPFPYMNMRFVGPAGSGKTTVADIVSRLLCARGILTNPEPVIEKAGNLVGDSHINSCENAVRRTLQRGYGGVVVLDEFYNFNRAYDGGNIANEALSAIMSASDDHKTDLCVIVVGYEEEISQMFRSFNPGLERRFPYTIRFHAYTEKELLEIFRIRLEDDEFTLAEGLEDPILAVIRREKGRLGRSFGNAGWIEDVLLPNLETAYYQRGGQDRQITEAELATAFPGIRGTASGEDANSGAGSYKKIPRALFDGLPALPPLAREGSLTSAYDHIEKTIFFVKTDRGSGTGFLIHPDGYAITCNHVVEGAESVEAILHRGGSKEKYACEVVNRRKDLDMALLRIRGVQNLPYLPIDRRPLSNIRGEEFELWGFPFGSRTAQDITNFPGSIASSSDQRDSFGLVRMHIAGEAKQGNSGSPLISKRTGCVIGILLGSIVEKGQGLTEEINGMRPIQYFYETFTSEEEPASTAKPGNPPEGAVEPALSPSPVPEPAGPAYRKLDRAIFDGLPSYPSLPDGEEPLSDGCRLTQSAYPHIGQAVLSIEGSTPSGETVTGNGFVIHPDGYALTANHLIEGLQEIRVSIRAGQSGGEPETVVRCGCEVINRKPDLDMALIRVKQEGKLACLPMDERSLAELREDPFELFDGPLSGRTGPGIRGRVLAAPEQRDTYSYIRIQFEAEQDLRGHLGSPLISRTTGRVIGILPGETAALGGQTGWMRPIRYFPEEFLRAEAVDRDTD